jgi:hypothetical protein
MAGLGIICLFRASLTKHFEPAGGFPGERNPCMSRAGGGEGGARNRALSVDERRNHVASIEFRGGPAIEANEPDLGIGVEERAKVV